MKHPTQRLSVVSAKGIQRAVVQGASEGRQGSHEAGSPDGGSKRPRCRPECGEVSLRKLGQLPVRRPQSMRLKAATPRPPRRGGVPRLGPEQLSPSSEGFAGTLHGEYDAAVAMRT